MGSCLYARKTAFTLALVTVILTAAQAVQAVPITFAFSGIIDAVYDLNRYGDNIKVGDAFSAAFTIDSTAPNQDHSNPHGGLYLPLSSTIIVGQGQSQPIEAIVFC